MGDFYVSTDLFGDANEMIFPDSCYLGSEKNNIFTGRVHSALCRLGSCRKAQPVGNWHYESCLLHAPARSMVDQYPFFESPTDWGTEYGIVKSNASDSCLISWIVKSNPIRLHLISWFVKLNPSRLRLISWIVKLNRSMWSLISWIK